ncbi:lysophospholipid acyltransferase family protein, partial [Cribrihabitans sp. XS_ASV171]
VQMLFGMDTIAMSSHKRHVALSREVLGKMKQGISIGIAADGPRGPERVCSTVPLVWARSSGKRVFGITYSVRHAREAGTWDRLLLPRPWRNEGVFLCSEWKKPVARKASEEEIEALRQDLEDHMNAITAEADRMVGRAPWTPA